jgi:hypothetical protein
VVREFSPILQTSFIVSRVEVKGQSQESLHRRNVLRAAGTGYIFQNTDNLAPLARAKVWCPSKERIEMAIEATRDTAGTLVDVIDRVLDKGLVINADIAVAVAGVELLGIKIRAALASFETAAKYGLEFPSGTKWQEAMKGKEECPQCGKKVLTDELLSEDCPWCGWVSAKAQEIKAG